MLHSLTQTDALQVLLARHAPGASRPPNERRLSSLAPPAHCAAEAVRTGHWRRVAAIAAEAIVGGTSQVVGASDITHVLHWWHLRVFALWKLRLFSQAHTEFTNVWNVLDTTLIQPEARPLHTTALVPYALHVVRAQDLYVHGQKRAGVTALWHLLSVCQSHFDEGDASKVWHAREVRVRLILASALVDMEAFDAAATVVDPLADPLVDRELEPKEAMLALVIARIYLTMGCVARAEALVAAAAAAPLPLRQTYDTLVRLVRNPHTSPVQQAYTEDADQALANAAAVDAFYRGDLDTGTAYLEHFLRARPTEFATAHGLAGNLITMHTMGVRGGTVDRQRIVRHVVQAAGDDPACIDSRMG